MERKWPPELAWVDDLDKEDLDTEQYETDLVEKYVSSGVSSLSRTEKFNMIFFFLSQKIFPYFTDSDMDVIAETNDYLSSKLIAQDLMGQIFGNSKTKPLEDSLVVKKKTQAMLRIRNTTINVPRSILNKNQSQASTLSISQFSRPGTSDSSSIMIRKAKKLVKKEPLSCLASQNQLKSLITVPLSESSIHIQTPPTPSNLRPSNMFSISFAMEQQLKKSSYNSSMKTDIFQRFSRSIDLSIEEIAKRNLHSDFPNLVEMTSKLANKCREIQRDSSSAEVFKREEFVSCKEGSQFWQTVEATKQLNREIEYLLSEEGARAKENLVRKAKDIEVQIGASLAYKSMAGLKTLKDPLKALQNELPKTQPLLYKFLSSHLWSEILNCVMILSDKVTLTKLISVNPSALSLIAKIIGLAIQGKNNWMGLSSNKKEVDLKADRKEKTALDFFIWTKNILDQETSSGLKDMTNLLKEKGISEEGLHLDEKRWRQVKELHKQKIQKTTTQNKNLNK